VFLFILWWDVFQAFRLRDPDGTHSFFIGGGSLAILASTALLTFYTLSCHSLRHIVGGKLDCFSCAVAGGPRQKTWSIVSVLNGPPHGVGVVELVRGVLRRLLRSVLLDGPDPGPDVHVVRDSVQHAGVHRALAPTGGT
jgi:hypothetical protein